MRKAEDKQNLAWAKWLIRLFAISLLPCAGAPSSIWLQFKHGRVRVAPVQFQETGGFLALPLWVPEKRFRRFQFLVSGSVCFLRLLVSGLQHCA